MSGSLFHHRKGAAAGLLQTVGDVAGQLLGRRAKVHPPWSSVLESHCLQFYDWYEL